MVASPGPVSLPRHREGPRYRPDPSDGGTTDPVTYIVLPSENVSSIDNHDSAVTKGRAAAQRFIAGY